FNERHPLALGAGGAAIPLQARHFLDTSDLILGIGCSFSASNFAIRMPTGKTVIHNTVDAADINKQVIAQHALIGDAQLTLRALIAEVKKLVAAPRDMSPVAAEIAKVEKVFMDKWMKKL